LYIEIFGPSIQAENMKDEIVRLMKEQEDKKLEISQLEEEAKGAKAEWTQKAQEYESQLEELQNKVLASYFTRKTIYWYI